MPLSLNAYAKHRGCALNTVQEAVRAGRLSKSLTREGKIRNAREADEEWSESTLPEGQADARQQRAPSAFVKTRVRLSAAKAELVEMQLAERRGELVQVREVEARMVSLFSACKSQLLAIPSRLRQEDPDLTPGQVGLVEKLVREALVELGTSPRARARRMAR